MLLPLVYFSLKEPFSCIQIPSLFGFQNVYGEMFGVENNKKKSKIKNKFKINKLFLFSSFIYLILLYKN